MAALKRKICFFRGLYATDEDQVDSENHVKAKTPAEGEEVAQSPNILDNPTQQPETADEEISSKRENFKLLVPIIRPDEPRRRRQYTYSDLDEGNSKKSKSKSKTKTKTSTKVGIRTKQEANTNRKPKLQFFEGRKILFYPAEIDDVATRIRMRLAFEHGADVFYEWDDDAGLTHVVVDIRAHNYQKLLEFLGKDSLPSDIKLVNQDWIPECIKRGYGDFDESRREFRVNGFDYEPTSTAEDATLEISGGPSALGTPGAAIEGSSISKRLKQRREKSATEASGTMEGPTPQAAARTSNFIPKFGTDTREIVRKAVEKGRADDYDVVDEAIYNIKKGDALGDDSDDESMESDAQKELPADKDNEHTEEDATKLVNKDPSRQGNFACMSKNGGNEGNPNVHAMTVFQQVAAYYEDTREQYRALSYRRVVTVLRKQTELIKTKEQAIKLKHIGNDIASEIEEIVNTGRLNRLAHIKADPKNTFRELFLGVYGVGVAQAEHWMARGWRTLEDVTKNEELTANQRIGIEHYDDFQQRIPRAEVREHEVFVNGKAAQLSPLLEITIGGSYRRGLKDSGDIDFLITSRSLPLSAISSHVFNELIPCLTMCGYLKYNLTPKITTKSSKLMCAASLPGKDIPWRRVDFLIVPWAEIGAAVLYWTGNDLFNRSMRLLARKKGMSLNQHGLWKGVVRGQDGKKVTDGTLVEAHDELKIFEILGVPWRPPEHRSC